ncbi:hypothetical protein Brms1b_013763 [Colletotrichum noveboracense]|nr:hypothetical protein Brms1b_013763 [Colletotrichum noveboracense]
MAHGDAVNEPSLERAFSVAKAEGFKLLFSFDYVGRGPWPKNIVIGYLKKFGSTAEYFKHGDGKPLVSTFEGPGHAKDWIDIKKQVGCFLIPDWSSKGAEPAMALGDGVADGLFNWAAWPWGPQDIDTYIDALYIGCLVKKPYMMPVSPWFYANVPGYNKNWLWRGDDIWHDRWTQVIYNLPEWVIELLYVQIISWNDYAESHYIAPVYSHALKAFEVGKAPFNYASSRPHDGWRLTLPFWIDYYKTGKATITQEGIVTWYRTSPASACSDGGTVGNTASQLQMEFAPEAVMQDKIFFSAVLGATAQVTVTVGGQTFSPGWSSIPDGGVGVYHGSISFKGLGGDVNVQLSRGSQVIARIDGTAIGASSCNKGRTNWNPWVGSALVPGPVSTTNPRPRGEQGCIKGTGAAGFTELCEFNCKYDYCPVSSCVCTAVGAPNKKPTALEVDSFPAKGRSKYYIGLCSSACNLGYCPEEYCSPTLEPMIVPTVSEFLPPACRAGTGRVGHEGLAGLCSYACQFGFCPIHTCQCTEEGGLIEPPPQVKGVSGKPIGNLSDENLCAFACSRAWCPADACEYVDNTEDDEDDGNDDEEAETNPSKACQSSDFTRSKFDTNRAG